MELITSVIVEQKKSVRNIPYENKVGENKCGNKSSCKTLEYGCVPLYAEPSYLDSGNNSE